MPKNPPGILAGSPALDRRTFPRPGSVARWFEPFHVRQLQVARGEVVAQVVAGADIVMAPAWLTHRRALESVGESRRAREWTAAAVRLAREAIETGLERRAGGMGTVLVAGPLPDVATGPDHATGHRPSASASAARDARDQAGILADTAVDLIVVEPRSSLEATLRTTETTAGTGTPVWPTIPLADAVGEPPLAERLMMLRASGAAGVLVDMGSAHASAHVADALVAALAGTSAPVGLVAQTPPLLPDDLLDACLHAGAGILGLDAGAGPDALRPLVEARDRLLGDQRERLAAERASLRAWVMDAARWAPGGRALWLGAREVDLPTGFDWTVVDLAEASLGDLPDQGFGFVVCVSDVGPRRLASLVEHGGVVALQAIGGVDPGLFGRLAAEGLTVRQVGDAPDDQARLVCRREDR